MATIAEMVSANKSKPLTIAEMVALNKPKTIAELASENAKTTIPQSTQKLPPYEYNVSPSGITQTAPPEEVKKSMESIRRGREYQMTTGTGLKKNIAGIFYSLPSPLMVSDLAESLADSPGKTLAELTMVPSVFRGVTSPKQEWGKGTLFQDVLAAATLHAGVGVVRGTLHDMYFKPEVKPSLFKPIEPTPGMSWDMKSGMDFNDIPAAESVVNGGPHQQAQFVGKLNTASKLVNVLAKNLLGGPREVLGDDIVQPVAKAYINKGTAIKNFKAREFQTVDGPMSVSTAEKDFVNMKRIERENIVNAVGSALDGIEEVDNLNPQQFKYYQLYKQAFHRAGEEFHVPEKQWISQYFHHMWDKDVAKVPSELEMKFRDYDALRAKTFIADFKNVREGRAGYSLDVANVFDSYLHKGYKEMYVNPALEKVNPMLKDYVAKHPEMKIYTKLWQNVAYGKMGLIDDVLSRIGISKDGKAYTLKSFSDKYSIGTYKQLIGGALDTGMVNMTQSLNTFAELPKQTPMGAVKLAGDIRGILTDIAENKLAGKSFTESIDAGLLRSRIANNPQIMVNFEHMMDVESSVYSKMVPSFVEKILGSPMMVTEYVNRGIAFYAGELKWLTDHPNDVSGAIKNGISVANRTQFSMLPVEANPLFRQLPTPLRMFTRFNQAQMDLYRKWWSSDKASLARYMATAGFVSAVNPTLGGQVGVGGMVNQALGAVPMGRPIMREYDAIRQAWYNSKTFMDMAKVGGMIADIPLKAYSRNLPLTTKGLFKLAEGGSVRPSDFINVRFLKSAEQVLTEEKSPLEVLKLVSPKERK